MKEWGERFLLKQVLGEKSGEMAVQNWQTSCIDHA
jgi:hypothetical protein